MGAQPCFSKISFNYRWLEDVKNMEVVLKAVPKRITASFSDIRATQQKRVDEFMSLPLSETKSILSGRRNRFYSKRSHKRHNGIASHRRFRDQSLSTGLRQDSQKPVKFFVRDRCGFRIGGVVACIRCLMEGGKCRSTL